jgi:hypothetical protein
MKTRKRVFFRLSLVCIAASLAACTLKLEDKSAPSLEFSLEADYDVKRWGGEERSGRAATPPMRKRGDADHSGKAFRIRGQFSNTFTWYDAVGTLSSEAFDLGGQEFPRLEVPVGADGWSYRGRLAIMPGFAFGGDKFFIAGLFGLEGEYLGMDLVNTSDPSMASRTEFGILAVPIGFYLEATIAHAITPLFTYAYSPTVTTWGFGSGGHSSAAKLGARLWPGSLFSALGSLLWLEGGWQWSTYDGVPSPFLRYEIDLSGPYGAIGLRF